MYNKETQKKYYENNKETRNSYSKKYNEDHKEEAKEYQKKYREGHKEERKAYQRKYNEDHKEELAIRHKEYNKKYEEINKEKISLRKKEYHSSEARKQWKIDNKERLRMRDKEYSKQKFERKLVNRYGISVERYKEMFIEQNFCCAICGRHQSELSTKLHIDHNHENGEVRGLLCHTCNTAIGLLKDNIEWIRKAAEYVEKNS